MVAGRLVMAHNPTGTNWGARTPLRLSVSDDNGALQLRESPSVREGESTRERARAGVGEEGGLVLTVTLLRRCCAGETWPVGLDIETTAKSEFSYPACCATALGDGVCVTYTWNRVRMKCVWISETELMRRVVVSAEEDEGKDEQPKL